MSTHVLHLDAELPSRDLLRNMIGHSSVETVICVSINIGLTMAITEFRYPAASRCWAFECYHSHVDVRRLMHVYDIGASFFAFDEPLRRVFKTRSPREKFEIYSRTYQSQ